MLKNLKKKIIFFILILLLLPLVYFGYGAFEYNKWIDTKEAIATGGFTSLFAGTLGAVMAGCTYSESGCTCSLCNDCGCNTFTQATIANGQTVNKDINVCVSNSLQVKGMPVESSAGKQFIAGSFTGNCLTANAVMATPSMTASNFEKVKDAFNKYIIAGFKE